MVDPAQLESLLLRYEELRDQQTPVSAEELCGQCPELLDEVRRQIRMLDAMNALLDSADSTPPDATPSPESAQAESIPPAAEALAAGLRYRVLRFHARGGLGEVHVARDEELHREVALKRLQPVHARNPNSRRRFLREAEITSRLEHPSIVPVHAVGRDASGHPFYAMRFVQGETLHEAIQRFHAPDQATGPPGARRLALRQLLGRLVAVCNTVAYAHSRGIVHRDIKPGNVLLGPYGETLLVDWGLAREVAARESGDAQLEGGQIGHPPDEMISAAHEPTQPGTVLGTPAYMSPEQAEGRWDLLGPASDVYSLGATLYVLLTGQPPFQSSQVGEVVEQVKKGALISPGRRHKDVPRALEAICVKAMARRPQDRYGSALELAADLEHWLGDEPVSAWREPWTVRSRRWLGRHRTLVIAATAAVLVATVSLAVATGLLTAANRRQREAQLQAAHNFRLARQAVEDFLTNVNQNPRLREHDLEGLQKELLRSAVRFHEEFVRQHSDDPEMLAEQGRAYLRLGEITERIASKEEGIQLYRQALAIFERLTQADPALADYQPDLAKCVNMLGTLYRATGRRDEAEAAFRRCLEIRDLLAAQYPAEAGYRNAQARTHSNLAVFYLEAGRLKQAEAEIGAILDIGTQLVQEHPGVGAYQITLAEGYNLLSGLYRKTGQPRQMGEALHQALRLWEDLVRAEPAGYHLADPYQAYLAAIHQNLGNYYSENGQPNEAESSYKKGLTIRTELARAHPVVSSYQEKLGRSLHNLAAFYATRNRLAEAEAAHRQALAIRERLVLAHPTVIGYAIDLGRTHWGLGKVAKPGNLPTALEWFNRGVTTYDALLQKHPRQVEAASCLVHVLAERADVLAGLGREAEALADWDRALQLDNGQFRDLLRLNRAVILAQLGDYGAALAEVETLGDNRLALGASYMAAADVYAMASAAVRKDLQLPETDRNQRAEHYATKAVQLVIKARAAGYFKTERETALLKNHPNLAPLRAREDFKELVRELEAGTRTERR
jgi:serine/threonine-protein kinase